MDLALSKLLTAPNFGQLATVNTDQSPHVDTVWFEYQSREEGSGEIRVATTSRTKKAKNLILNPKAFMVVTNRENPYEQAQLILDLLEYVPDEALEGCDRVAMQYTGRSFPQRHHKGRVMLVFSVVKAKYHIAKV